MNNNLRNAIEQSNRRINKNIGMLLFLLLIRFVSFFMFFTLIIDRAHQNNNKEKRVKVSLYVLLTVRISYDIKFYHFSEKSHSSYNYWLQLLSSCVDSRFYLPNDGHYFYPLNRTRILCFYISRARESCILEMAFIIVR